MDMVSPWVNKGRIAVDDEKRRVFGEPVATAGANLLRETESDAVTRSAGRRGAIDQLCHEHAAAGQNDRREDHAQDPASHRNPSVARYLEKRSSGLVLAWSC
jgi:hypothetical protein